MALLLLVEMGVDRGLCLVAVLPLDRSDIRHSESEGRFCR